MRKQIESKRENNNNTKSENKSVDSLMFSRVLKASQKSCMSTQRKMKRTVRVNKESEQTVMNMICSFISWPLSFISQ
jgi:hypothetical protein